MTAIEKPSEPPTIVPLRTVLHDSISRKATKLLGFPVTRDEAYRWRLMARVPKKYFEAYLRVCHKYGKLPSENFLVQLALWARTGEVTVRKRISIQYKIKVDFPMTLDKDDLKAFVEGMRETDNKQYVLPGPLAEDQKLQNHCRDDE